MSESEVDVTGMLRTIREGVRGVVEGVLADIPGDPGSHRALRAAGDRLVDALVDHADTVKRSRRVPGRVRAGASGPPPTVGGFDDHARAFRAMAGVRL